MHSQLNILPPNAMQLNITDAIDLTFYESPLTATDDLAKATFIGASDFILHTDAATKEITDKRVNDTLKIHDWLEVKQSPQSDPWSDE